VARSPQAVSVSVARSAAFFYRHPRAFLLSERLAEYIVYDLTRVMQSLETLITAVRYRERDRDRFDPEHELEYLCDVGAAEILLPAEEFESDLAVSGSTLRAVPALRERYQASREATVRRMVQMGSERTAAVFLEYRLKPSEKAAMRQLSFVGMHEAPQPKLRIAYVVPSERFTVFLPPHKSIPDESCVDLALETGEVETAEESWDVSELPPCLVEAMSMPPGDDAEASLRAVALLTI